MPQTILIVDDDPTQRRLLETAVSRYGFLPRVADSVDTALALLAASPLDVDLVLLDLVMPELTGLQVLEQIKPRHPELPVIVLTAHGGVDTVVKAMRAGASDFLVKPVSTERLKVSIDNALKLGTLTGELLRLSRRVNGVLGFGDLIGQSPAMVEVIDLARRAAASTIPILIEGESGVGKELLARAIQGSSERAGRPFVVVNCGAIPDNLVESILFGHEKGSFTGATERHIGKFQEASGGTLFLDEIGELKPDIQVKLLRALQEGEIDPVGGSKPLKVDIRLISATNRDLLSLVREGRFREDLYYRLNVYPIRVPPLRERNEDIPLLVGHFVSSFAAAEGKPVRGLLPDSLDLLTGYAWPGNVRQLENAVFRAVVLCDGEFLAPADFPQIAQAMGTAAEVLRAPSPAAASEGGVPDSVPIIDQAGRLRPLSDVEGDMIRLAIRKYNGQMSEVARRLGIGRSTLYRKVRDLGIGLRETA